MVDFSPISLKIIFIVLAFLKIIIFITKEFSFLYLVVMVKQLFIVEGLFII